ncbi:MAG: 50S ribosomal protein L24 [Actinobacteria bacterium 13_1_20CM_3_71_11]|nr:MAG: 50S ribosomal protein L24 [Actinobacteria bacterium 13_1_20CM_3_71_11]
MKVKKGDTVVVVAGKDRGAIKKHTRIRTTQRGAKTGGIVTQEAPISVSNVMVVDTDGRATRVGYRFDDNGQKVRVARRSGKDL